ncbi:MAG: 4Fe-4S dicluster domain-containing protein [Gammaproteobacteria bacterium]
MRLPAFLQPRVLRQVIRALLSKPYTTRFPAEPFEAIEAYRGRPRFDAAHCIGCGACAEVCPPKCIDVSDRLDASPPQRTLVQHMDQCIECGQCERYCPTQAGIRLSNEFDFAGFAPGDFEERVDKELVLCEVCGDVVAPRDQLRWLSDRLGPLAFANPTLMILKGQELGIVDDGVRQSDGEAVRGDRLALQCPRCRRRSAFAA